MRGSIILIHMIERARKMREKKEKQELILKGYQLKYPEHNAFKCEIGPRWSNNGAIVVFYNCNNKVQYNVVTSMVNELINSS